MKKIYFLKGSAITDHTIYQELGLNPGVHASAAQQFVNKVKSWPMAINYHRALC